MRCFSLALFLILAGSGVSAVAQDAGPKDFYNNDFVNQPGGGAKQGTGQVIPRDSGVTPSARSSETPGEKPKPADDKFTSVNIDASPAPSASVVPVRPEYTNLPNIDPQPIVGLSLIANGMDGDVNRKYLRQLFNLCAQHKMMLDNLYVVGPTRFVKMADQATAAALGGQLRSGSETDTPFSIKRAPTWVIRTRSNSFVLEGLEDIQQFVDQSGNLNFPK